MSERVEFSGVKQMGVIGIGAGCALALGSTWLLLTHGAGSGLPTLAIVILIALAIIVGGIIALVAAFFSLVMPSKVQDGDRVVDFCRSERQPAQDGTDAGPIDLRAETCGPPAG